MISPDITISNHRLRWAVDGKRFTGPLHNTHTHIFKKKHMMSSLIIGVNTTFSDRHPWISPWWFLLYIPEGKLTSMWLFPPFIDHFPRETMGFSTSFGLANPLRFAHHPILRGTWRTYNGFIVSVIPKAHDGGVNALLAAPAGGSFYSGGHDGFIKIWRAINGHPVGTWDNGGKWMNMVYRCL